MSRRCFLDNSILISTFFVDGCIDEVTFLLKRDKFDLKASKCIFSLQLKLIMHSDAQADNTCVKKKRQIDFKIITILYEEKSFGQHLILLT